MSANTRRELVERLLKLSEEFPTVRLRQLTCNLASQAGRSEPSDIWEIEDEELLNAAREWLEFRRNQLSTH